MENIIVRIIDLPEEISAVTVIDADGNYNVYLNARNGDQYQAFCHEMAHIKNNDFYNEGEISFIESRAG